MRLLAVDPGLANTGLVMFEGKRIVGVRTVRTKATTTRPDFATCLIRSQEIAREIASWCELMGRPDVIVAETYRDIPGTLRQVANRWTTPLTIGVMYPTLTTLSDEIVWQDPERVMTAYARVKRLWALGTSGVCVGDASLRNDHVRSAACHGLFYLDTHKAARA
jgi:hypothetical protein